MDVYYDLPDNLLKHQAPLLEAHNARTLTTWPLGTFVENLLVRQNGEILVSVHSENRLECIGLDGSHHILAHLPSSPTSLIEDGNDLFVFGGAPGRSPSFLWSVAAEGTIETRAEVAAALFLNGSSPFLPGFALAVDSLLGKIFQVNLQSGR